MKGRDEDASISEGVMVEMFKWLRFECGFECGKLSRMDRGYRVGTRRGFGRRKIRGNEGIWDFGNPGL